MHRDISFRCLVYCSIQVVAPRLQTLTAKRLPRLSIPCQPKKDGTVVAAMENGSPVRGLRPWCAVCFEALKRLSWGEILMASRKGDALCKKVTLCFSTCHSATPQNAWVGDVCDACDARIQQTAVKN